MSDQRRILCERCGERSIEAPEGATDRTRYVCATCSPAGPEVDHFQTWQFEKVDASSWAVGDVARLLDGHIADVLSRRSVRVMRAGNAGESWAVNATPENVAALPPKARQALLMIEWCGLTRTQAAILLHDSYNHVNRNMVYAKKLLSSLPQMNNTVRVRARRDLGEPA